MVIIRRLTLTVAGVAKNSVRGYTVAIGWDNFTRVFTDEGIQKPFFAIFVWTVVFSVLTVILTVAVGMVLACLVQWESLKGKAIYRVLLILPYAVPSFISILIFKGLFNQSFGEINMMLSALFGIKPTVQRPNHRAFDDYYRQHRSVIHT